MNNIPKNKLNKLKRQLNGHIRQIAREIGYSHVHVTQVLNGEYFNDEILIKCVAYRNALLQKKTELSESI